MIGIGSVAEEFRKRFVCSMFAVRMFRIEIFSVRSLVQVFVHFCGFKWFIRSDLSTFLFTKAQRQLLHMINSTTLLLLTLSATCIHAYRPRNPHKATDKECRPKTIFRRTDNAKWDHEAQYDLEKIIPNSLDGCHTLWLSDFELWDEGAIAIAQGLKGHTDVHTVYMHFSQVGDEGAEAFAELLKTNQALHTINLGHNSIESEGAIHLAEALKVNTGLHTLTLDHNKIHEAGKM